MTQKQPNCQQCERPNDTLKNGVCNACRSLEDATLPPATHHNEDATIAPSPTSVSAPNPTTRIGEYDLIEEIARGGMGVVYKARHRNLNRITAIKMVLGGRFSSDEELQRFQVEAESAAKLDHPSIVPIYEIGESEGQAYFAMKYVEGGSLADQAADFRNRPRELASLMIKVAEAVFHAHQRGVLHRDLKPANILLDSTLHPFVTDLGLAKSTTGGSDLTHTGAVLGTPSYMPPEQASGDSVTTAADIYSLGAIMYELLVGRPPYQGDTSINIVMQVLDSAPPAPHKIFPDVERDLELICMKCLERSPESRYSTAQGMAKDLNAWLAGDSISIKPPSLKAVASNWLKQNQRLAYTIFALLIGVLICAPIVLGFFSADHAKVYEHFPADQRPILFWGTIPKWLAGVFAFILFLLIWPAIGLINAVISKPPTLGRALRSGLGTSFVLSLIFYLLVGWLLVMETVNYFSDSNLRTMTDAVWPADDSLRQDSIKNANELYGGLGQIPEQDRAEIVAKRIKADRYASVPFAIGIGLLASFGFSVPIIYGTIMGSVLAKRDIPSWVFVMRYVTAWWLISALLLSVALLIASNFTNEIQAKSSPASMAFAMMICLLMVYALLRKWRRKTT